MRTTANVLLRKRSTAVLLMGPIAGVALALVVPLDARGQGSHATEPACAFAERAADPGALTNASGGSGSSAGLLHEGARLRIPDASEESGLLQALLPDEVFANAEVFLGAERTLRVGACRRHYPVSDSYGKATRSHRGRARIDGDGNLRDYVAGLPFPPETIAADAPDAGIRWAWNFAMRDQGAGPVGKFRLVELPRGGSREGRRYEGSFFLLRTRHRADRAMGDEAHARAGDALFVAGGRFERPFSSRHLAWRQTRPEAALGDARVPDDIFVYVSEARRPRRSASAWVDGVFTPRYTVSGEANGSAIDVPGVGAGRSTLPGAAAATEHIGRGFTGLTLRPNAYSWRLAAVRDVLAPLNGGLLCETEARGFDFGASGLSLASAPWDLRQAVVLEARGLHARVLAPRLTLIVDRETQQPLFLITRNDAGAAREVAIFVHRYSTDVSDYPDGPGGSEARVFDPVAAVHLGVGKGAPSWRRESCDVRSTPVDAKAARRMTSTAELARGR